MKVWMWPKSSDLNLYNDLLTGSLSEAGLEIEDLHHGRLFLQVGQARPGDIVHIHWMHHAYQHENLLVFLVKSALFLLTLTYLKLRNIELVWTIHNLYPHHVKYPRLEKFMRKLICRFCSKLIVASASIKMTVMREFGVPASKLFVVKHGHYRDVYKRLGHDVRQSYGIGKDADVYLFLGSIKAYKGVEDLVEAFRKVCSTTRSGSPYLIVAGKADSEMQSYLRGRSDTAGLILELRFIPNEEVADLLDAADVMVMPYKEITTSGSAILGLSFKKRIVMPENDFIREYSSEDMVVAYDPTDQEGLAEAMIRAMEMKRAKKRPRYEELLKELEWSNIAQQTKDVYLGWR
ncbi:glycosyltransferase family 4 protein [Gorillibacterium massiliense]|uniref:glycosyltransferase family 4 protein n=1 Tax=Gorillibacterium massiliense TaxID=1280390 RepID=UPI0004B65AA6|nr:glycosyltransferase family 4 protein [Gorillibacterium massiliense]